ncbi:hypothetical protein UFOVP665_52 [uncultured Caudovirales phage]|uniref:Uncharacterized protein n=1 Tax=uncultured Caudovirales phage TaxID=2100421 RepID=A0A6J5NFK9_9CAUD|nr:hypothetical protein UFOVP665_52 [uncultured Caudovirales phage]
MAINPNTTFTAGAVYTADQSNRFPRGIMAYAQSTTSDSTITAEETQLTASSFVAISNRYYRITYYEPDIQTPATSGTFVQSRIKIGATVYTVGQVQNASATVLNYVLNTSVVVTGLSGATVFTGTLQCSAGTALAVRAATAPAYILVEDIGPA